MTGKPLSEMMISELREKYGDWEYNLLKVEDLKNCAVREFMDPEDHIRKFLKTNGTIEVTSTIRFLGKKHKAIPYEITMKDRITAMNFRMDMSPKTAEAVKFQMMIRAKRIADTIADLMKEK